MSRRGKTVFIAFISVIVIRLNIADYYNLFTSGNFSINPKLTLNFSPFYPPLRICFNLCFDLLTTDIKKIKFVNLVIFHQIMELFIT